MAILAVRYVPRSIANSASDHKTLVTILLFCAIGLLVGISTILIDQYASRTGKSIAPESMLLEEVIAKVDLSKLPNHAFEDHAKH